MLGDLNDDHISAIVLGFESRATGGELEALRGEEGATGAHRIFELNRVASGGRFHASSIPFLRDFAKRFNFLIAFICQLLTKGQKKTRDFVVTGFSFFSSQVPF